MKDTPVLDAARTVGPEDHDAVPGIVQAMARELGDKLERILVLLEPMPRIEAALADLRTRMHAAERDGHRRDDKLDDHAKQIAEIKIDVRALKAKKKKQRPRKKART